MVINRVYEYQHLLCIIPLIKHIIVVWIILGDKDGRCVGLTITPPSCAGCLEILGTVGACTEIPLPY